jgi:hypothetical protein
MYVHEEVMKDCKKLMGSFINCTAHHVFRVKTERGGSESAACMSMEILKRACKILFKKALE